MSVSRQDKLNEQIEFLGKLCDEDLDAAGQARLNELLAGDVEAQRRYVRYLDLQAAMRMYAQAIDDEDFARLEVQAALDSVPACMNEGGGKGGDFGAGTIGLTAETRADGSGKRSGKLGIGRLLEMTHHRFAWTAAAAMLLVAVALAMRDRSTEAMVGPSPAAESDSAGVIPEVAVANLRGTVGARWAGVRLEMPEGESFIAGQRIELVEGLAEVVFGGGAKVILQGPAIVEIQNDRSIGVSVGRIASVVPHEAGSFAVKTAAADLTGGETEFGTEIDVDGSLVTQVYVGEMSLKFNRRATDAPALQLASGQGAQVDAKTGEIALLPQPNELHFVRYLPHRETRVNLAEVVADGDSIVKAYHRGISLEDGRAVDDYGVPAVDDGNYKTTQGIEFVDGVFIPNGKLGAVKVDSIGRSFGGFPTTAGDSWGGAIMARRPRNESSLPLIRLEFHGNNYGYVNWLHIASKPDELSPDGLGLIGMHANSGITFDLHAIRARYPDKKILRFRSLVGNLESRMETEVETHTAEAWVLVDGQLRHHRRRFSRESGPDAIDIPLADRDRFLVLVVTDDGGDTAYDWVAFGDAVIELTNLDTVTDHESEPSPGEANQVDRNLDRAATAERPVDRAGDLALKLDV